MNYILDDSSSADNSYSNVIMHSTVCLSGGSASAGHDDQEDPLSFLTTPTSSIATLRMQKLIKKKTEMQKQKKREIDRRYRQNKKKAVEEAKNELAMTIIKSEKLKFNVEKLQQEIFQLKKKLKLVELRPMSVYAELAKEVKYLKIENEMAKCLLDNPNTNIISNMIKILRENEELKRAIERYEAKIFAG